MIPPSMPARFCPRCAARAVPNAKFCTECGASLGGPAPSVDPSWRLTTAGASVLVFFLVAGLTIWTAILSPSPPRPGPGASRTARTGGETPKAGASALPKKALDLIAGLAAAAKDKPDDVAAWLKLAEVYSHAAEFDHAYQGEAVAAFQHVLDRQPKNEEALRGIALAYFDQNDPQRAAAAYERYLVVRPDDIDAHTYLATSYAIAGDVPRGLGMLREIVRDHATSWLAHYYLGAVLGHQGDRPGAETEFKAARQLATDEVVRKRIDETLAGLTGQPAPAIATDGQSGRSHFQSAVEEAFRGHPIMGPRIVRFEWSSAVAGRVVVANFPMDGMPPEVREKFTARLSEQIRQAEHDNPVDGRPAITIADATSGAVMATLTP